MIISEPARITLLVFCIMLMICGVALLAQTAYSEIKRRKALRDSEV